MRKLSKRIVSIVLTLLLCLSNFGGYIPPVEVKAATISGITLPEGTIKVFCNVCKNAGEECPYYEGDIQSIPDKCTQCGVAFTNPTTTFRWATINLTSEVISDTDIAFVQWMMPSLPNSVTFSNAKTTDGTSLTLPEYPYKREYKFPELEELNSCIFSDEHTCYIDAPKLSKINVSLNGADLRTSGYILPAIIDFYSKPEHANTERPFNGAPFMYVFMPATCTSEGQACLGNDRSLTCTLAKLNHNVVRQPVIVYPTCTSTGCQYNICYGCDTKINLVEIPVNKKSHTGEVIDGGTVDAHTKYSCCEAIVSNEHTFEESTVLATCTAKGVTTHTCDCGYSYTTEIPISESSHTGEVVDGGTADAHTKYSCCGATVSATHEYDVDSGVIYTPATCTEPQYNYKKCSCGYNPESKDAVVSVGEPLGHNYGTPTYVWDGYSKCTATSVCANNPEHVMSEDAVITANITTVPTCVDKGVKTYTATFDNPSFAEQTKTEELNTTEHKSGDFVYEENGTIRRTYCTVCDEVLSEAYKVTHGCPTGATCDFEDTYLTSDDVIDVKCTVEDGYTFVGTTGVVESNTNEFQIKDITAPGSFTVIVKPIDYQVKGTAGEGISEVTGSGTFPYKSKYTLTAEAKPGYTFVGWTGDVESSSNPLTGTVPLNGLNVTAVARPDGDTPFTVRHFVMGVDGNYPEEPSKVETFKGVSDTAITNLASYSKSSLQIANGILFDCVKVGGESATSTNLNADGSTVIDLYYERVNYTVNYNAGKGVEDLPKTANYYYGATVTVPTATYAEGYTFGTWSGDYDSTSSQLVFTMPAKDVQLTLNGKPIDYAIHYTLNGGGFTSSYCKAYTIEDINTILINPSRLGYNFLGWTGSNGTTPETQITIEQGSTGERSYEANWETIKYTILYDLGGGQFAVVQPEQYDIETSTFTVAEPVRENYDFAGWEINGTAIPSNKVSPEDTDVTTFMPCTEDVIADRGTWIKPEKPDSNDEPLTPVISEEGVTFNKGTAGNYTLTALWTLQSITVDGVNNVEYTGNPVTFDDVVLRTKSGTIPETSYDVTYKNNVDIGTACITYTLKNGYEGTVTKLFNITMPNGFVSEAGDIKYEIVEKDGEQVVAVTGPSDPNATSVTIPDTIVIGGVTYKVVVIKADAFKDSDDLTKVEVGANVSEIEDGAFSNCPNLEDIKATIDIPSGAVSGCAKLEKEPTKTPAQKPTDTKVEEQKPTENKVTEFVSGKYKYAVTGNNTVKCIGAKSTKATSVTIPSTVKYNGIKYNVTEIGSKAFYKMSKLKKVTIGSKVTKVGKSAFEGCSKITTVTVGSAVKTIDSKAFYKCSKLKTIKIKSTKLTKLGSKAFGNIYKKAKFDVPNKKIKAYKKIIKSKAGFTKTMQIK